MNRIDYKDIEKFLNSLEIPFGMSFKEYAMICNFINNHNIKNIADVGVGRGYSYIVMNKFTNAKIYPIDGYVDNNYQIGKYLPKNESIRYLKLPEDLDYFESYLIQKNIDFALLDDGHDEELQLRLHLRGAGCSLILWQAQKYRDGNDAHQRA